MAGAAVKILGLFLLAAGLAQPLHAQGKSRHDLWESQLQKFVSKDGKVNYKAWGKDRKALDNYIAILAENPPTENSIKNDLLAYWINAYNALTVQLILDHYPIESIKDLSKPWSRTSPWAD